MVKSISYNIRHHAGVNPPAGHWTSMNRKSSAMKTLLPLLLFASGAAFAAENRSLRALIADMSVSFPREEMQACAGMHPEMAEQFNSTATRFSARIEALLGQMTAQHALLAQPVPDEMFVFQDFLVAQTDTDFRQRTLQECLDRIVEFDSLKDDELKQGMAKSAEDLSGTLRQYRENMDRAIGVKPES